MNIGNSVTIVQPNFFPKKNLLAGFYRDGE